MENKEIDWEQRRFELVKSLLSTVCTSALLENYTNEQVANTIIGLAGTIIKKLRDE